MNRKKISEVLTPLTVQIMFHNIGLNADIPQLSNYQDEISALYLFSHSFSKYISPYTQSFLSDSGTVSVAGSISIGTQLAVMYGNSWKHLWDSYNIEYNPIENYNMTDTTTDETTRISTPNLTHTNTGTVGIQATEHSEANRDTFGFNSVTKVPEAVQDADSNGDTETDTNTKSQTVTTNRKGNIGATTTQFMLNSERETWVWNFYNQVFDDIDKILTLAIY